MTIATSPLAANWSRMPVSVKPICLVIFTIQPQENAKNLFGVVVAELCHLKPSRRAMNVSVINDWNRGCFCPHTKSAFMLNGNQLLATFVVR